MWDKLVASLTDMLETYRAVLVLSRQKKELLAAGKASELDALTKQLEPLVLHIGKLETAREKAVAEIAQAQNVDMAALTLETIRTLAGPDIAAKLKTIEAEFKSIMKELEPLNRLNMELAQQALTYTNFMINFMAQNTAGSNYAGKGQTETAVTRRIFDHKV